MRDKERLTEKDGYRLAKGWFGFVADAYLIALLVLGGFGLLFVLALLGLHFMYRLELG